MDKLLSSNSKSNQDNEDISKERDDEVENNDASNENDEKIDTGDKLAVDSEKIKSDDCREVQNEKLDVEKEAEDAETQLVSSTDEALEEARDEAADSNERLENTAESTNEEPVYEKENTAEQIEPTETDAEAGGMLRAAVDGLPIDLENAKEEPAINASEEQIENDSMPNEQKRLNNQIRYTERISFSISSYFNLSDFLTFYFKCSMIPKLILFFCINDNFFNFIFSANALIISNIFFVYKLLSSITIN